MSTRFMLLAIVLASVACGGGSESSADTGESGTSSDTDPSVSATTVDASTGPDSNSDPSDSDPSETGDTSDTGDEPFMPIGIPEPEFGIHELAPAMPNPWDAPIAGAYYVDNTHPSATTDEAATGTPDAPRATIPSSLTAGSTVWIAGGPYPGFALAAAGTADAPVFVTAADPAVMPVIEGGIGLSGQWLAIEYLDIAGPTAGVGIATPSDHVAVRHCEVHDGEGGGSGLYTGRWEPEDDPAIAEHIVFYANDIHDNGDVDATFDEDHHGISLGHHAAHVWIIDNELARNSGDGLQVNAKKAYLAETLHHVWVGRNLAYENKQTGLWTKMATDVVFSQNVAYGHRPSDSSEGACIGYQYGPERVWMMFNVLYDCEVGIRSSTNVGDEDGVAGSGQDVYIIGNLILGIYKQDGSGPSTDPWQGGAGIGLTDQDATKHIAFNTIVGTDVAFTYARGTGGIEMINNMLVASAGMPINIESAEAVAASSVDHNLFDVGAMIGWGDLGAMDVAGLQAIGQCSACVLGDPMFVDADNGDFHLQDGSPGIDAAGASDLAAIYEELYGESIDVDLERAARSAGGAPDLGAYERG